MNKQLSDYVPALSHDWLTPFYDTLIKWTMPESTFKRELVEQAHITSKQRILDLGCGTATLTILIKSMHPDARVIGIDGDPKILEIGRTKAAKTNMNIMLAQAMSFELPYPSSSFDCVLSSLMFHHLTRENKVRSLKEIYRVLRNGGKRHIADFGKPQNLLMRIASYPWRVFDGSMNTIDIIEELLPTLMRDSGFVDVRESVRYMTLFGTLSLYASRKA
jgi:ubiquinone/menaquinone biosynthesis C-methylase UbiE